MQKIIAEFIDAMSAHGIHPSTNDIIADNKLRYFHIQGTRKTEKKGYYKLRIEKDFGYGYFGDWRDGDFISWHSKYSDDASAEEIKKHREHLKKIEHEERIAQEKTWEEKAKEAQSFVMFLERAEDQETPHIYLRKKGIKPYSALVSGLDLILPMTDGQTIQNYQKIMPDGQKRFLTEAKKQGCWHTIQNGDPVSNDTRQSIYLVEGFATGASIAEATGDTVICAMDAGNLVHVAPKIKELYPQAEIIICADNDQWTTDKKGRKINTGIAKAKQAADLISCRMVYPDFGPEDEGLTDFNDLHKKYGIEAVRDRIRATTARPAGDGIPLESPVRDDVQPVARVHKKKKDEAWRDALIYTKKGKLEPHSTVNVLLMMEYDDELEGVFRYDSFSKTVLVHKQPPWEDGDDFQVRTISDYDYVRLEGFLELRFGLKTGKNKCADVIYSTACLPANEFNPARDYFRSCADLWDRVPRLDTWLRDYVSDGSQPHEYLSIVGTKFVCGLAARAMNAGIKFDTMIILEGKQNAGKSYLSRIMGTIEGREYFLDDFKDIESKDSLMKMQGKLVIEFPEISTMRRAEVNDLKGFLSRQSDVFRPPYGHNTIESPRQCVFVGTVNPEGPYLRDVTDNRRYWPVATREKLDVENLKKIMPQLHAEAAWRVNAGEPIHLTTQHEYDLCKVEQAKRQAFDVWEDRISECIGNKSQVVTADILMALGISIDKANPLIQSRITQTMVALGYRPDRVRVGSARRRGFVKIGTQNQQEISYQDDSEDIPW